MERFLASHCLFYVKQIVYEVLERRSVLLFKAQALFGDAFKPTICDT